MTVKKTIERDLQRQVQMMLGTMMGQDKVDCFCHDRYRLQT